MLLLWRTATYELMCGKHCLCLVPGAKAHGLNVLQCMTFYEKQILWFLFCINSQVLVNLEEGLGVSLVNKVPEELVFTTLSGIDVHFIRTAANEVLELSIQNIQVSSPQLWELSVSLFKFELYLSNTKVLHMKQKNNKAQRQRAHMVFPRWWKVILV